MSSRSPGNEFLNYLVEAQSSDKERLPSLSDLSRELGISVATLREQLEVARVMGLVEVKPRTGMRQLPYSFRPMVEQSLSYAIAVNPEFFQQYADLRKHLESSYWIQAVSLLTPQDHHYLQTLVNRAFEKLERRPPQIPHQEHRELHLCIYRRLNNPFVDGLLEAYWGVYEAAGLDVYNDLSYLQQVWHYHQRMVDAICAGDIHGSYQLLSDHMDLITQRPRSTARYKFE